MGVCERGDGYIRRAGSAPSSVTTGAWGLLLLLPPARASGPAMPLAHAGLFLSAPVTRSPVTRSGPPEECLSLMRGQVSLTVRPDLASASKRADCRETRHVRVFSALALAANRNPSSEEGYLRRRTFR